jgi:hypothetical protein
LHEVIKNSSGMSWMGVNKAPVPNVVPEASSSDNYKPGFRVELMIKDLSLGVAAGEETGIEPTIARKALETYHKANEDERCKVGGYLLYITSCTRLIESAGSRCLFAVLVHHQHRGFGVGGESQAYYLRREI